MPFPDRVTLEDGRVAELRAMDAVRPEEARYYVGSSTYPDSEDGDYRTLIETTARACAAYRRFDRDWPFHHNNYINEGYRAVYVLIRDVPTKQPKPELTPEQISLETSW